MELEQDRLIRRVREGCANGQRLVAALMDGSFATAEGDARSDIEFLLYFDDDQRDRVDRRS